MGGEQAQSAVTTWGKHPIWKSGKDPIAIKEQDLFNPRRTPRTI